MTKTSLKKALKEVLVETMQEQRQVLTDAFIDAMEEIALALAIKEGGRSKRVSRNAVMRQLKRPLRRSDVLGGRK
jgi:hypothetical protein